MAIVGVCIFCYVIVMCVHENYLPVDISVIEVGKLKQCFLTFGNIFIF